MTARKGGVVGGRVDLSFECVLTDYLLFFFVKVSTSMNCIKPHPFSSLLGEGVGIGGLETRIFNGWLESV